MKSFIVHMAKDHNDDLNPPHRQVNVCAENSIEAMSLAALKVPGWRAYAAQQEDISYGYE